MWWRSQAALPLPEGEYLAITSSIEAQAHLICSRTMSQNTRSTCGWFKSKFLVWRSQSLELNLMKCFGMILTRQFVIENPPVCLN